MVESVEDENEEDDKNAGVEPPLRRSVRDRKEKEIFDPSSYLQTNTEEKKVTFEDQVPKQKILEEYEYNLFTQSLDSNKKLKYSYTTIRIIANVMVDIRSETMEREASFVQQYPLKRGLKVFGETGKEAALKEVDQLYKRSIFTPMKSKI